MRFWPFKKWDCRERGHQDRVEKRQGYATSCGAGWPTYCVAEWVEQERKVCPKCGDTRDWVTVHGHCLQGTSMPTAMARTLEEEGFVRA